MSINCRRIEDSVETAPEPTFRRTASVSSRTMRASFRGEIRSSLIQRPSIKSAKSLSKTSENEIV